MCQRLSLLPEVVTDAHRLTLGAIVKYTGCRTVPKPTRATVHHLQSIGRLRMYWGWARLYFLIVASIVYLWRVQDAAAMQWHWLRVPGWITFYDHKVNRELVSYPLSQYLDTWRAYVVACKRPTVPSDAPAVPGGTRELQRAMAALGARLKPNVGPSKLFQCSRLCGRNKKSSKFIYPPSLPVHGGKICCLLALGVPAGMLIFVARRVAT